MAIKHILIDLDGTLTDPKVGIHTSIRYAMDKLGYPLAADLNIDWTIGPPLKASLAKLLATQDDALAEQALLAYRERFSVIGLFENEVYPSVAETLKALKAEGYRLFVATAKPTIYAKSSRKYKKNLDIRLAEVRYLIQINQPQLALEKLEKIIQSNPHAEEALFIAGLTSIDLKQYDKAEQYLVDLRNSAKYQNEAYYYLAINAERKQHYETAKAYYRLVDGSLYIVSRRNLIAIYDKQENLHDALRFLTQERVNYP
ncbi:HAD hydrolase-like protein, partial [Acinetobacter baumannii]